MEKNTTDNGMRTIWKDMGSTSMLTRCAMMDNSSQTKNKDMASTPGLMDEDTKAGGTEANNMDTERIKTRTVLSSMASGRTEKD